MFKMSCGGSGEVVACNYSTNKHPFVDAITSIRPASYVRIPTLSRLIDDVISCRWSNLYLCLASSTIISRQTERLRRCELESDGCALTGLRIRFKQVSRRLAGGEPVVVDASCLY